MYLCETKNLSAVNKHILVHKTYCHCFCLIIIFVTANDFYGYVDNILHIGTL